jgi:hypothetical protein
MSMSDTPTVDLCVAIHGDCPITYLVAHDGTEVEFSFGGKEDGFHHVFDARALRRFLAVGARVLSEMEHAAEPACAGRC